MKNLLIIVCIAFSCFLKAQDDGYELVWYDEFNENGAVDSEKWHHQTQLPNGGSWYNGEIQHYTNREVNSFVSDGTLKIVAKKETFTDQGFTKSHTSARLNSKFAFTYGYVAVRAKLPQGEGTWPAIWMLGQNITEQGGYWYETNGTVGWPACGEIDIMEHWGTNQNFVQSATHTPSSFGNTVNLGGQNISTASSDFHIYALEWTENSLVFSVDDQVHYVYEPAIQNANTWPFDLNQYILFNVAILPEITPSFTQSALEIDYIRIYQEQELSLQEINKRNSLLLKPNPAQDTLTVQVASKFLGANCVVYNLTGQQIFHTTIKEENFNIDISRFAQGLYLFKVTDGANEVTKKLVKR